MASASKASSEYTKIEGNPEPDVLIAEPTTSPVKLRAPANPRDPENSMRQCSGLSKKTAHRCGVAIGKKSQKDTHPTLLPTCSSHRDQQSLAAWCQFKRSDGERCGRLLRWRPPYFELCDHHQGHPGTPCYFLRQLPLELRHQVYRYLLPTEPIGSSTAAIHQESYGEPCPIRVLNFPASNRPLPPPPPPVASGLAPPLVSAFPMRLTHLLLVSRQIHDEVKDLLFSVVTFKIDVRKDGAFMCGRRLLEPKRADGSSHMMAEEADEAKKKFLTSFAWAAVKNYTVDILLENWGGMYPHMNRGSTYIDRASNPPWDEEVEIYDIRDYVSVVVSGILAKSKKLCKLQVRLGLHDFQWDECDVLSKSKLLFSPFGRLRNVRQPSIGGIFDGRPSNNSMYSVIPGTSQIYSAPTGHYEHGCSVPSLPTNKPMLVAGMPAFDAYATEWRRQISSESSTTITEEPPIRKMFAEFRNFYTELANYVPAVTLRRGKHTFLHQARVAREHEDVIAFRSLRNELIHYWEAYKAEEERKKQEMNKRLGKLLESDMYPSHEWEDMSPARPQSPSGQAVQSPVLLDSDRMAREGIPMTGNCSETSCCTREQLIHRMRLQQQQRQSQIHVHTPASQRLVNDGSTNAPRRGHPTLSDYALQHRKVLEAQQQTQYYQQQAQQKAQQQAHHQARQQCQARQHALCQESRRCLAKVTQLKNQERTIRHQANQTLSLLRTGQHPTNFATRVQVYRKQAHGITLAVLEAQRELDAVEREKRSLETCLTATAFPNGMSVMNTAVGVIGVAGERKANTRECLGKRREKDELGLKQEEEVEDRPDTLDNEDLHPDSFCGEFSAREKEDKRDGKREFGSGTAGEAVGDTVQTVDLLTGVKREGSQGTLEERLGGVEVGVGVPGPSSTKKRRIDSGYCETTEYDILSRSNDEWKGGVVDVEGFSQQQGTGEWKHLLYVGKGKGRMDVDGDAEVVSSRG